MKIRLYYILAFILLFIGLSSCEDERIYDPSFIGEGEATIAAEITFTPLQAALSRAVEGGTEGNAHKVLNNIHLVFYKENGEFAYHFPFENPDVSPSKDKPSDKPGDGEHRAEEETLKSSLHIPMVSFGKYKIYVLANIPSGILTDDLLSSADNLKKITLEWNDADISANNQMFGYISENNTSNGFEAPVITINKAQVSLHGWIKRAASKVTVAFDGTNLKPGVEIFIKSIEIKDIPKYCYLGANNPAEPEKEIELINKGQSIIFDNGKVGTGEGGTTTYDKNWIGYVSKDHPVNGYDQDIVKDASLTTDEKLEALHSERMKALYLYENLQGMGVDNTPSDKRQQVNENHVNNGIVSYPNGVDPSDIAWKDAKKYGSYIEVKAYYRSHNEKEGEGDIVYRFMLGKDTHLDYNTERNYHYKLTLKFKGWANDVDWHIDYTKEPPEILRFKQPFYISYLYGQVAMVPMEFETAEDVKITKISATILENNWAPDAANNQYTKATQPNNSDYTKYYLYVSEMDKPVVYPYNGFLSLRKPKNLLVVPGDYPLSYESNKKHYEDNHLGIRTYSETESQISTIPLYQAMAEDKLYVEREGKTYFVKMPVWTRARQLITTTGYTGNNPYNAYYRKAKIHVEIELSNGKVLKSDSDDLTNLGTGEKDITIKQVRRLVNPKGIWRSNECSNDFHVVLKVLADDASTDFVDLKSEGGWRAYVIRDTEADEITGNGGFISLKGAEGTTTARYTFEFGGKVMTRNSIEGNNSNIDFTVDFKGKNTGKPRYAVIRVEYNYNSCYHLIFVRQGYEADDTFGDGNKWCTANMYDQNNEAKNPLDEGSLFRFGNWVGIKAESNQNHKRNWTMIIPNDFRGNAGTNLNLTNGQTNVTWPSDNTGVLSSSNPKDDKFDNPGKGYRFANYEDYSKFIPSDLNNDELVANFHIKTGNGVLYGDGATETASTIYEAFGYIADGKHETYGMRGCFVYDIRTGKNLFFPIGNSGYGHRKNRTNNLNGVLRYSVNDRWGYFNAVNPTSYAHGVFDAPLFLDIFRSPGAIYWYQSGFGSENVAWDINYATFDFKNITLTNVYNTSNGGSDACFIRCISTE